MRHLHTLRLPRRPRRENHVRGGLVIDVHRLGQRRVPGRQVDRHHRHPVRPGPTGTRFVGHGPAGSRSGEDPVPAHGRLIDTDRHVHAAGGQHPQHRHHLLRALAQRHRHRIARRHTSGHQRPRHPQRRRRQIPVGHRPRLVPQQRRAIRVLGCPVEEPLVQQPARHRSLSRVHRRPHLALILRQDVADRGCPVTVDQPRQQPDVRGEHRLHHTRREQPRHHVPVQQQATVELDHLMIEPHLGGLGDPPDALGVRMGAAAGGPFSHAEGAGEHDRHGNLGGALPAG
ncbi:hypothetical protein B0E53_06906 [Micromonospora sp. MH33]|nr:hypothetical protein B0E53_06906 [Micromonospora sp. MH33]